MADNVGEEPEGIDEHQEMFEELLSPLEHDPSKAELMCICTKLNQLLISLRFKRTELQTAETDLKQLKGLYKISD